MTTAWRQKRTDRFRILHRDQFTCRYCGARPGAELLEVDHLVPRSRGGSDHECNLVTACKTCNRRKSDTIFFPHDLIEKPDPEPGWFIHKTFGEWSICFSETRIGIDSAFGYGFIDSQHWPDHHFWNHLCDKVWDAGRIDDLMRAASHLKNMVDLPCH